MFIDDHLLDKTVSNTNYTSEQYDRHVISEHFSSNNVFTDCFFYMCSIIESNFYDTVFDRCCFRQSFIDKVKFTNCKFINCTFRLTSLIDCDFTTSTLENCNFDDAPLYDVNLQFVNFVGKNILPHIHCPEVGSFVGWKKAQIPDINRPGYYKDVIIKLIIPIDAKRSSATSNKCRASTACVVSITDMNGTPHYKACSFYDPEFIYEVGEVVKPTQEFDENRWRECSSGIHFFLTAEEAIQYG